MDTIEHEELVTLDLDRPIWERFFTVAPLVVVGTCEDDTYTLAPKHMAMPLGGERYYGFACTPRHPTYQNIKETGHFTVSYPRPGETTAASFTVSERNDGPELEPSVLEKLPTIPATVIDGVFLKDAYLFLECELDRTVDDLDGGSLIIGRVVAVHVREEALRVFDGNDQELVHEMPLLAYLHPGRYATVRDTHALPFSADSSR